MTSRKDGCLLFLKLSQNPKQMSLCQVRKVQDQVALLVSDMRKRKERERERETERFKIIENFKEDMVQVMVKAIECLLHTLKALSSNPNPTNK
jgi:hypothetical protein